MNLSQNFTLQELIKSDTAIRKGIDNNPNGDQVEKLKALCENVLQPVEIISEELRSLQGSVRIELVPAIGSSEKSQHAKAEAVDFECIGVDNAEVADWVHMNCETDQLIFEFYTPGEPNSDGYMQVIYRINQEDSSCMLIEKIKSKYKPVIGKAKDLV